MGTEGVVGGVVGGASLKSSSSRRYSEMGESVEGGEAVGAGRGLVGDATDGVGGAGGAAAAGKAVCNELVVDVLGNWGHDKMVGLTEVELFDCSGSKIRLAKAQVLCLLPKP